MEIPRFEEWVSTRNKSRKDELSGRKLKGEKLTKEEEAELRGLRVFPDNPRGANLLMRDVLGQTSEEEKEELRKLFQRRQFSPEVNDLGIELK